LKKSGTLFVKVLIYIIEFFIPKLPVELVNLVNADRVKILKLVRNNGQKNFKNISEKSFLSAKIS
jgi:hypothetical protein